MDQYQTHRFQLVLDFTFKRSALLMLAMMEVSSCSKNDDFR